MTNVTATTVRDSFSETLNRVAFKGDRIILERHGKPVAALVSVEDLELLEELKDRFDVEAVRAARDEPGDVPYRDRRTAGLAERRWVRD
jgi:prevent-host-death family protein